MKDPLSSKPWATAYDKYGDPAGEVTGNPEGLRRLRDMIDEALVKGEVEVPRDAGFDFCKIKVQEKHPEEKPSTETTRDKLIKGGCISVLLILAFLVLAGVVKTIEWFTN